MDTKQTIVEGVDALTLNGKSEPEAVETATDAQAQEVAGGEGATANADDVVDPWNVASTNDAGVDYDKLISMQHEREISYSYMKSYNLSMCDVLMYFC